MGYSHTWEKDLSVEPALFRRIVADFERVVLALDDRGVHLAGPLGEGLPEITATHVAFNGVFHCGHPVNKAVSIPYPDKAAWGVGDSSDAISGEAFLHTLLRHRTCDGICSFETFTFEQVCEDQRHAADGRCFGYCKTGFRPYDLAVQCFLLIAKHHLRERIAVRSGGRDEHWQEARAFCYAHLEYPLFEFRIDREAGLIEPEGPITPERG